MRSVLFCGTFLLGLLGLGVPVKADLLQYDFQFSEARATEFSFIGSEFGGIATIRPFAFSLITDVAFGDGSQLSPSFSITGYRADNQGQPIAGTEFSAGEDSGIATLVPSNAAYFPPGVGAGDGCFEFPVVGPSLGGPGTGGYDNNCNLPGHGNYFALVRALFPDLPHTPGTYSGQSTFVWEALTGWGEGGSNSFGPSGQVSLTIIPQVPEPASLVLLLPVAVMLAAKCRDKFRHR